MTTTDIAVSPRDVATIIATGVDPDDAVSAMDREARPAFLYALDLLATTVGMWRRCVTAHLIADGRMGETFEFDGKPYRFENERRGEFQDLGSLFSLLERMGVSVTELGAAAQGARVTDLERAASHLPDEVRQGALDSIKSHRVYRDGSPKLVDQDEKASYRKPKGEKR